MCARGDSELRGRQIKLQDERIPQSVQLYERDAYHRLADILVQSEIGNEGET